MVMHLMSSKKEACDFNELVGEAVPDVLLTDQPVTYTSEKNHSAGQKGRQNAPVQMTYSAVSAWQVYR